uniref:N-acetyltransferase domain-containing protein n=1 Tax=Meloidogyne hapla TaxID=6305 RepID=A0A1I8BVP9_MELHA
MELEEMEWNEINNNDLDVLSNINAEFQKNNLEGDLKKLIKNHINKSSYYIIEKWCPDVCPGFYRQVGFYSKVIWGSEEMGAFIVTLQLGKVLGVNWILYKQRILSSFQMPPTTLMCQSSPVAGALCQVIAGVLLRQFLHLRYF